VGGIITVKKLIVNADDFGYNEKINQGIIAAHKDGVVTSTSLMVTKEGFNNAVELAKENSKLSLGIHLDLDEFFDIDHTRGKIIGFRQNPIDKVKIESEIKRQFDTVFSKGLKPDHLTGHHHSHMVKEVFEILVPLMKQYNIPSIRFNKKIAYDPNIYEEQKNLLHSNNIIYPPHFIEGWYWGNIDEPFTVAELMTHPGYGELWREYELLASCDTKLKNYLREKNIQLITYTELVEELKLKSN
jgi:predicted glycoside hydrolase/deacetylase ChbG (UPF0249 family)